MNCPKGLGIKGGMGGGWVNIILFEKKLRDVQREREGARWSKFSVSYGTFCKKNW